MMPDLPVDQPFDPVRLCYAGTHIEAGPEIYGAKGLTRMSTLRVPLPPDMLEDHLNQAFGEPRPANTGLQDGMLAYYQSQIPLTEGHEEGRLAREYFDCRDMLGTEKK